MRKIEVFNAPAEAEQEQQEQEPNFDAQKAGHRILEANAALGFDSKGDNHDAKLVAKRRFEALLSNHEELVFIRNGYLEQYADHSRTTAEALYTKDGLDHYVLEQLSSKSAADFVKSPIFDNYSRYIYSLARNNTRTINGRKFYPEFSTNPVLRNPQFRELILSNIGFGDQADNVKRAVNARSQEYLRAISYIDSRIEKRANISQDELDAMGDYLYSSRQFDSRAATNYACYLFNEGRKRKDLKASTEMCGALTNYFAHEDSRDPRLHDTRVYIANFVTYDSSKQRLRPTNRGVSAGDVIALGQDHVTSIDLSLDEGLQRSRQSAYTDLYSLMMVTYHELTHSYQALQMKDGKKNSSAMSMVLNKVLQRNQSECFPIVDANLRTIRDRKGDVLTTNYYNANHDSDEIEIEADEESWNQCRKFIRRHEKQYHANNPDSEEYKTAAEHWTRCIRNAREVAGRRSFALKVDEEGVEMPYIQYDIEQLTKSIQQNPELLQAYPQLADYFDKSGNIRPEIFFNGEIAGSDFHTFTSSTDNFGVEVATYALLSGRTTKALAEYVNDPSHNISQEQVKTCLINLWNTLHQPAIKTRALKGLNFDNYVDTKTRGKFTSMSDIKRSYLGQYIRELYNAMRISHLLKRRHPEMTGLIEEREQKYFASYYGELSNGVSLEPSFRDSAKSAFRRTGHSVLAFIASIM